MRIKIKAAAIFFIIALAVNLTKSVYAQTNVKGSCPGQNDVQTAIGCIDASGPSGITQTFFNIGVGIAGGIAFLLILYGGFTMMVSAGNPEKLNEGRELVGSAVAGLLFIILSIFLLKVIGVDILAIPGFSG